MMMIKSVQQLPIASGSKGRVSYLGEHVVGYVVRVSADPDDATAAGLEVEPANPYVTHLTLHVMDWEAATSVLGGEDEGGEEEGGERGEGMMWVPMLSQSFVGRLEFIHSNSRKCQLQIVIRSFAPQTAVWTMVIVQTHEDGCGALLETPRVRSYPIPGGEMMSALGSLSDGGLVYARENDFVAFRELVEEKEGGGDQEGIPSSAVASVDRTRGDVTTQILMPLEISPSHESTLPVAVLIERERPWGSRRRKVKSEYTLRTFVRDSSPLSQSKDWKTFEVDPIFAAGTTGSLVLPKEYPFAGSETPMSAEMRAAFSDLYGGTVSKGTPTAAVVPHSHDGGILAYGESLFTFVVTGGSIKVWAQPLEDLPFFQNSLRLALARSGRRALYVVDGDLFVLTRSISEMDGGPLWDAQSYLPVYADAAAERKHSRDPLSDGVSDYTFVPWGGPDKDDLALVLFDDGHIRVYDLESRSPAWHSVVDGVGRHSAFVFLVVGALVFVWLFARRRVR